MNFLLSYVLKSLDSSRVKILSKRNGEKIESYCRSSIFKLEMQKSTSKQPYIFEMETKLLSPTLYSSYIMLSTFFCKKRSSYLMYEDMVVVVNIQESRPMENRILKVNSEWIYEVTSSPKMPTKKFPDFCTERVGQKSGKFLVCILGEMMTS